MGLAKREPIADVEAERSVLGSMIAAESVIAECELKIHAGYFSIPAHQLCYAELIVMWHDGKRIDLVTFTAHLRDRKLLDTVGGIPSVTALFTAVPSPANIQSYLEIVRDKYILRQLASASSGIEKRCFEEQSNVEELLSDARDKICLIDSEKTFSRQRETSDIVSEVLHDLDNPETALGTPTGFESLDEVIGGMAPKANIVIAGPISGGKSALAQAIANHVGITKGIPTAIFTFEMSDNQTIQRIIQIRSEVSARSVATRAASMFEIDAFGKAASEVSVSQLRVISERLDVAGIRARCMQLKPRIAIIDYLQIIPEKQQKNESRTERFDRMSAEVKQIAMQLGITTITLSQLNEKLTTYGSRMVTGDADILIVIESDDTEDDSKPISHKNLVIAKQRDGSRPTLPFTFVKAITKFREGKK